MSMRHVFRKRFRARRVVPLLWPGRLLNAASLLLERDQVRARERHGIWLQGLVRQVRIAGIQDIIKPDGRLVVAAGRGCIHRNDDGVIVRIAPTDVYVTEPLIFQPTMMSLLMPFAFSSLSRSVL